MQNLRKTLTETYSYLRLYKQKKDIERENEQDYEAFGSRTPASVQLPYGKRACLHYCAPFSERSRASTVEPLAWKSCNQAARDIADDKKEVLVTHVHAPDGHGAAPNNQAPRQADRL